MCLLRIARGGCAAKLICHIGKRDTLGNKDRINVFDFPDPPRNSTDRLSLLPIRPKRQNIESVKAKKCPREESHGEEK